MFEDLRCENDIDASRLDVSIDPIRCEELDPAEIFGLDQITRSIENEIDSDDSSRYLESGREEDTGAAAEVHYGVEGRRGDRLQISRDYFESPPGHPTQRRVLVQVARDGHLATGLSIDHLGHSFEVLLAQSLHGYIASIQ